MYEYKCRRGGRCAVCTNEYLAGEHVVRLPGGRAHPYCATIVTTPSTSPGCPVPKRDGQPCSIPPTSPGHPCHVHDAGGKFASQQGSEYRKGLYQRRVRQGA